MRLSIMLLTVLVLMLGSAQAQSTPAPGHAPASGNAPAPGGKEVRVFMYSEYIDPDLLTKFQQQTGQKVVVDVYENSEDMLAKMRNAGGERMYDVLVVSDVIVPALIRLKLVRELDGAKLDNSKHIAPEFTNPPFDPGAKYSRPYLWGTIGLMYRKDKFPPGNVSWAQVFDPKQQPGPFLLMDSQRDMLGIALRHLGKSMNSVDPADLKAAAQLLIQTKKSPKCLGFAPGVSGMNQVLSGQAVAAIVYNGDAVREIHNIEDPARRAQYAYAVPQEGGVIWTDVMLATSRGPNPEGAHQFINFLLEPANGAQLANFLRYATPNQTALKSIREEDLKDPAIYPPAEVRQKLEYLHDLGANLRLYTDVWTMVKSR